MAVDPAQAASSTAAPPPKLLHRHPADWTAAALQALQHCGEYPSHRCWIELFEGDADSPLVICAPHDGTLRPPQLSVRQSGTSARDTGTKGLAAALALEVLRRGGRASQGRPAALTSARGSLRQRCALVLAPLRTAKMGDSVRGEEGKNDKSQKLQGAR